MSDFVLGIATGAVLFGLYTWWLIEVAATVAIRRIERSLQDSMPDDEADIVNRLDRMWRGERD